jgi:hypothetical protein
MLLALTPRGSHVAPWGELLGCCRAALDEQRAFFCCPGLRRPRWLASALSGRPLSVQPACRARRAAHTPACTPLGRGWSLSCQLNKALTRPARRSHPRGPRRAARAPARAAGGLRRGRPGGARRTRGAGGAVPRGAPRGGPGHAPGTPGEAARVCARARAWVGGPAPGPSLHGGSSVGYWGGLLEHCAACSCGAAAPRLRLRRFKTA